MSLVALRTAIVSHIGAQVSAFQVVRSYGGTFNRTELKRIALKSPACLISVLGGDLERHAGQPVAHPTIAAFVVTRGTSEIKRDFILSSVFRWLTS